ncbi:HBL/NHE enterotoxin family protein [Rickettsiella massiliensis]|uniref:HBL/NHE enterotoxin family protein n=1 Tax=Rickettsiella massiliensis TaxID=676517 RepID=UPI00029A81D2|nr:HBL/NHE enterotoxin family protein [Rickettsiella massiliensis]
METQFIDKLPQYTDIADLQTTADKQLEEFYKTLKRMQYYCITVNTTPDLNWKKFMAVYRYCLDADCDTNMEKILNGENQQQQLREYTGEYLNILSPKLNNLFNDIQDFSDLFIDYFDELDRSIKEKIKGSTEEEYKVVIEEFINEIENKKNKNTVLSKELTTFSDNIEINFQSLSYLKSHAKNFLTDKKVAIESIEQELEKLEKEVEQEQVKKIEKSYQIKEPISFLVYKNKENKPVKEEHKENNKDKIKKIDELKRELMDYESDYANLNKIFTVAVPFRSGIFSLIKETKKIYQTWVQLELFLLAMEDLISQTDQSYIEEQLLPFLNKLKDNFVTIRDTVQSVKKITNFDITLNKEDNSGNIVTKTVKNIRKSHMLNYFFKN